MQCMLRPFRVGGSRGYVNRGNTNGKLIHFATYTVYAAYGNVYVQWNLPEYKADTTTGTCTSMLSSLH